MILNALALPPADCLRAEHVVGSAHSLQRLASRAVCSAWLGAGTTKWPKASASHAGQEGKATGDLIFYHGSL